MAGIADVIVPVAEGIEFTCPECRGKFRDHISHPECCVGGHWTPHGEKDVKLSPFERCCHKYQQRIADLSS